MNIYLLRDNLHTLQTAISQCTLELYKIQIMTLLVLRAYMTFHKNVRNIVLNS